MSIGRNGKYEKEIEEEARERKEKRTDRMMKEREDKIRGRKEMDI